MKWIKWVIEKIKLWLWKKPIEPPKLMNDIQNWIVIDYHGQKINMRKSEVPLWNTMSRKDRRGMARKFEIMEKKGLIRFEQIENKWICIKNKDYNPK